jgi:hypothetical protein
MKNVVKSWRFLSAEPVTKSKTMRPFPGEKLVQRKGIYFIMLFLVAASMSLSCDNDDDKKVELWQPEIDRLRAAITPYDFIEHAGHDGYNTEVTGYRTHMGFHYLNASLLDDKFEVEKPELLLYVPDGNKLKFVAVEYAVPIEDLNNPPPAPEGFQGDADVWEINTEFKLWTLHVWVKLENPDGLFAPHNMTLP